MAVEDEFVENDAFEEFRARAREYVEWQFGTFDDMNDDLMAVILIESPTGMALVPVGHMVQGEESKEALSGILPDLIRQTDGLRYAFLSSTWQVGSTVSNEDSRLKYEEFVQWRRDNPDLSLGAHPDAFEAITCVSGDWTGEVVMDEAKISRHDDAPPTLAEWSTLVRFKWIPPLPGLEHAAPREFITGRFIDPAMAQLTGALARAERAVSGVIDEIDFETVARDLQQAALQAAHEVLGLDITTTDELPEPEDMDPEDGSRFAERVAEIFREQHPEMMESMKTALYGAINDIA